MNMHRQRMYMAFNEEQDAQLWQRRSAGSARQDWTCDDWTLTDWTITDGLCQAALADLSGGGRGNTAMAPYHGFRRAWPLSPKLQQEVLKVDESCRSASI